MRYTRSALAALLMLLPCAAFAAPVFPGASGVGLEPPPGMSPAKGFNGFQGSGLASILITEMPKAAYGQIDGQRAMFVQRFGAKQADEVDVGGAHGFLVKGLQKAGDKTFRKWILVLNGTDETALLSVQVPQDDTAISDAAVDAALHSVAFRPRPNLDQQVAALPFAVSDLAGFRISASQLGLALILTDGPQDVDPHQKQAHVVVAMNEGPGPKDDRAGFAKQQLEAFRAVRTTQVTAAKTFQANGADWAEVDAQGTEGPEETPVAISYFLRFDAADTISVVCVAPQAEGAQMADRFKTLATSTKPKA